MIVEKQLFNSGQTRGDYVGGAVAASGGSGDSSGGDDIKQFTAKIVFAISFIW